MKLSELYLNPDNPRKIDQAKLEQLVEKLKKNEGGLRAMRIAYVVDQEGKKVVISGNTRLMALKKIYGDDWEVPAEYVQDLSSLSEAERHEFILDANHNDGEWDLDKLLEQYQIEEMKELGLDEVLKKLPTTDFSQIDDRFFEVEMPEPKSKDEDQKDGEKEEEVKTAICPHCGKETKI